jgi:hypothetical protein
MADQSSSILFEDVPLDEARMDPTVYNALKETIQSLDSTVTRLTIPEGTSTTTMRNRILRVVTELGIPVTVRKVPGGLLFWCWTDEDVRQAKEAAARLQTAQGGRHARPTGRRSRGNR